MAKSCGGDDEVVEVKTIQTDQPAMDYALLIMSHGTKGHAFCHVYLPLSTLNDAQIGKFLEFPDYAPFGELKTRDGYLQEWIKQGRITAGSVNSGKREMLSLAGTSEIYTDDGDRALGGFLTNIPVNWQLRKVYRVPMVPVAEDQDEEDDMGDIDMVASDGDEGEAEQMMMMMALCQS